MGRRSIIDWKLVVEARNADPTFWTWEKLGENFNLSPQYIALRYGQLTGRKKRKITDPSEYRARQRNPQGPRFKEPEPRIPQQRVMSYADLNLQEPSIIRREVQERLMTRGK